MKKRVLKRAASAGKPARELHLNREVICSTAQMLFQKAICLSVGFGDIAHTGYPIYASLTAGPAFETTMNAMQPDTPAALTDPIGEAIRQRLGQLVSL